MAIITEIKDSSFSEGLSWTYPNHFVSEKEKETETYWKKTMDYYATVAMAQYRKNQESIITNYKLLKGHLTPKDFYLEAKKTLVKEAQSLLDVLEEDMELPSYIKHYPILNSPINTLTGEMSKRPDNAHVKAFDDDSKSEQGQALTDMYQQYMEQLIREKIIAKMQSQEQDTSGMEAQQEQVEKITQEQMEQYRVSYTTIAEKWGAKTLDNLKVQFGLKQKSEDSFRDLLITSTEFIHIQPDGSKIGFSATVENPANIWLQMTSDKRSTKDAYTAGTIHVREISELIELYPFLTKKEINHLNDKARLYNDPNLSYTSPLVQSNPQTGADGIKYHTYDPLIEQRRKELEIGMMENALDSELGLSATASFFGNKVLVIKAYWKSKKKIGKLTYYDEDGQPQTIFVDENYKKIPEEISIDWGYINQWWEGLKIGDDIYYSNPLDILPYCPIIGIIHENKNTKPASMVDLMKPFQIIYNICINQLYRLLEKDQGKLFLSDIRQIPTPKDGSNEDAIEQWMLDAQELGMIFIDNSPDNTKGPTSFNQFAVHDMSRASEMQVRFEMAQEAKNECWELLGINRQRQGQILASDTVGGTDAAMNQSYAQTENYFLAHEYLWNDIYQAILDAAMYIELQKPESTLSYITGEGENVFIKINRSELLRDLQVFVSSRAKDQRIFKEVRGLAQPMLQNGAGFDTVLEMFTTDSIRTLKESVKRFQKKKEELEQQAQQQKQQEMEQQQQQFQAAQQQQKQMEEARVENENYNKDLDRINSKEIAIIKALGFGQEAGEDLNNNGIADINETAYLEQSSQKIRQDHQVALQKQQLAQQQYLSDNALKQQQIQLQKEKLKIEQERTKSQERIANIKAKQTKKK